MAQPKIENKNTGALQQIRRDVLNGEWPPRTRLQPAALAKRIGTSTTVVREALTRLAGEGLIRSEMNRGFFVPAVSAAELRDITRVRCTVEGLALEMAIDRGDLQWESSALAAYHELSRTPRRASGDPIHVNEAWADAHRRFHVSLLQGCGVPSLMTFAAQLNSTTELYRRWAAPTVDATSRDVEREHAEILAATLERDAPRAVELLQSHYELTTQIVLQSALVAGSDATEEESPLLDRD